MKISILKRGSLFTGFFLIVSLVLFGCGGGGGGDSASVGGSHETDGNGSIAFGVQWEDLSDGERSLGRIDCDTSEVAQVTAEVYDSSGNLLTSGGPWSCAAHSGTIDNVPAGADRKVVVKGMSPAGEEYYRGEASGITVAQGMVADAGMIEALAVVRIKGLTLHYRTYPNASRNKYQGYYEFSKAGETIETEDIVKLVLTDENGNLINTKAPEFIYSEFYKIDFDPVSNTVSPAELDVYSDYSINFTDDFELQQGNYTLEATTANGQLLRESIYFPGRKVLPTPDAANIEYQWSADGSLMINWENPEGDYNNINFYIGDQNWKDLIYIDLPADVEQLTIPAQDIRKISELRNPIYANLLMRYRALDDQNVNYARSYSETFQIPWNDITIDFLDYWPLTPESSWFSTGGGNEIEKTVIEDNETIHGVEAVQRVHYSSDYENMIIPDDAFLWSYDSEYIYQHGEQQIGDPPWNDDPIGLSVNDPPIAIKRYMKPGESFSASWIKTMADGTQTSASWTWENLGFEDVSVPAGYFPNCLKVRIMESGDEPDESITWFAKGVGEVQEEEVLPYQRWNGLIGADIVGYTENISVPWIPQFIYRSYSDPTKNGFSSYITLKKNGASVLGEDITKIELRRRDYTLMPIEKYEYSNSLSYGANWNVEEQRFNFYGPAPDAGFGIYFPKDADYPEDYYIWEFTTAAGDVVTQSFYFPGKKTLPVPDAQLMNYEWLSDGSLALSWTNPPGEYGVVQVGIWKEDGADLFYSRFDSSLNIEEMVIPRWVIQSLTMLHNPQTAQWTMRVRSHTDEGMMYARAYSDVVEIPWTVPENPL